MEHAYHIDDHVRRQIEGPQGRDVVEQSNVYTIFALLPVEADGRLRYRIKSKEENFERIVTEDSLSRLTEPPPLQCGPSNQYRATMMIATTMNTATSARARSSVFDPDFAISSGGGMT